jgi:hypothetical protein
MAEALAKAGTHALLVTKGTKRVGDSGLPVREVFLVMEFLHARYRPAL